MEKSLKRRLNDIDQLIEKGERINKDNPEFNLSPFISFLKSQRDKIASEIGKK